MVFTVVPDNATALVILEPQDDGSLSASLHELTDAVPLTREQMARSMRALADQIDDENRQAGD